MNPNYTNPAQQPMQNHPIRRPAPFPHHQGAHDPTMGGFNPQQQFKKGADGRAMEFERVNFLQAPPLPPRPPMQQPLPPIMPSLPGIRPL